MMIKIRNEKNILRKEIKLLRKNVRKIKEYWCLMWHITGVSESAARAVLRTSSLDATLSAIEQILLSLHTEAS